MNPFAALAEPLEDRPCVLRAYTPPPARHRATADEPKWPQVANPWGLSAKECAVMGAVVKTGSSKHAADALRIGERTVENMMGPIKKKMKVSNRVLAALEWDRFIRSKT